jgi:hypothetical protein
LQRAVAEPAVNGFRGSNANSGGQTKTAENFGVKATF